MPAGEPGRRSSASPCSKARSSSCRSSSSNPAAGEVIAFASNRPSILSMTMELRPDDFGITLGAADLAEAADDRGPCRALGGAGRSSGRARTPAPALSHRPVALRALPFTFHARSWDEGAAWLSASTEVEAPLTGCESLAFAPQARPAARQPGRRLATGLRMELSAPAEEEGSALAECADQGRDDRAARGPDALTGRRPGADRLQRRPARRGQQRTCACPAASKVGTVELGHGLSARTADGHRLHRRGTTG